jgi:hypothetical protein
MAAGALCLRRGRDQVAMSGYGRVRWLSRTANSRWNASGSA